MTSIIDDIISGAKSAADKVGTEAGKIYDVTKLRINVAELRRDLDKKYSELGMLVYASRKKSENVDARIEQCVAEIDDLKKRIDELNARSAEKRNKKVCPDCGQVVEKTAKYCHICGSEV